MLVFLALACIALAIDVKAWQTECQSFQPSIKGVTLVQAIYYSAGDLVNLTSSAGSTGANRDLPDFCRLQLLIETNPESGSFANTEVWLPDAWQERFLAFGNGSVLCDSGHFIGV